MATGSKSSGRATTKRRMGEAPRGPTEGRDERDGAVVKRSLAVAGHRTSISLEEAFWSGLRDIAAERGLSVAALVAEVDRGRGPSNLSSALRVFVLTRYRGTVDPPP